MKPTTLVQSLALMLIASSRGQSMAIPAGSIPQLQHNDTSLNPRHIHLVTQQWHHLEWRETIFSACGNYHALGRHRAATGDDVLMEEVDRLITQMEQYHGSGKRQQCMRPEHPADATMQDKAICVSWSHESWKKNLSPEEKQHIREKSKNCAILNSSAIFAIVHEEEEEWTLCVSDRGRGCTDNRYKKGLWKEPYDTSKDTAYDNDDYGPWGLGKDAPKYGAVADWSRK